MSRFTRFQKIVIGIILVLTIFGFITKSMQDSTLISKYGYDGFTMLRYTLIDHPIETMKNWVQDFSELWQVKEENDKLRNTISKQKMYDLELREAKRENAELKEQLKMKDRLASYGSVSANVQSRDASMWNSKITIDVGSDDGIKKDMAVMSSTGMIGRVDTVNKTSSIVKLLSDEQRQENVSVKVSISDSESAEGILEYYDVESGCFIVTLFTNNDKVEKKMNVITSGLGGKYPSGLFIGTVKKIEELDNKIGKTLFVTPGADFQNFHYVEVVNYNEAGK